MKKIAYYRYPHPSNVGDNLTPYILAHFRPDVRFHHVSKFAECKLMLVGSIMRLLKAGDIVIGTGIMRETDEIAAIPHANFRAVRGKLTRDIIIKQGGTCPEVYGDPAVLLPLMFRPTVEITTELGIIPHYIEKCIFTRQYCEKIAKGRSWKIIDVLQDYQGFVREVLSCETVISSSLHGIIIAESYGLRAAWIKPSEMVIGDGFKFRDYLTGTDRKPQKPGLFPPLDPAVLKRLQKGLLEAIAQL